MFVNNTNEKDEFELGSKSKSANSLILNLESIKKKYIMTLNQYDQEQKNYFLYLSQYPPGNYIKNGNFLNPLLSTNSYSYITSSSQIPDWNFQNAALINQSTELAYPIPYPDGIQAVSLQKNASISQKIQLNPGTYQLSFYGCGRNCCDNSSQSNTIQFSLNGNIIYSILPINNVWTLYTSSFTLDSISIPSDSFSILIISGIWSTSDRSSAIQNIKILNIGYKSVPNSSFLGESPISVSVVDDLQSCIASCSSLPNQCSGATYNKENNMCSLSSGKGSLVLSPNGENIAIVTENLYYLSILQQLNEQLLSFNNQMKNIVVQGEPIYEDSVKENELSSESLKKKYKKLVMEREKIKSIMIEYEKLNLEQENTSLNSNSAYFLFLFLFLITIFFILLFLFIFNKIGSSSSSSFINS